MFYLLENVLYNNLEETKEGWLNMLTNRKLNILSAGIVLGSITGAVTAYLFAPQNSNKTKQMLARKANTIAQTSILRTQSLLIDFEMALEKSKEHDINL